MNILDCIGNTPLLYLQRISRIAGAHIYAKVETYNPTFSILDRVAYAYIKNALDRDKINKNRCVVEASDGNFGISLAHVCVQLDLRLMLCMPASVSRKHYSYLRDLGVHVFLTGAEKGMQGALDEAVFHHEDTWGSFRPKPFTNPDGPKCYYNGLGCELVEATRKSELNLDAFICAVESGATFTGVGKRLREENPTVFLGATELTGFGGVPSITGDMSYMLDSEKSSNIEGEKLSDLSPIFDRSLVSQIYTVDNYDAVRAQKRLLSLEGIKGCIASAANIHAALLLAQQEKFQGKNIFTIIHNS